MHTNNTFHYWADPVVHLFLLKSSMSFMTTEVKIANQLELSSWIFGRERWQHPVMYYLYACLCDSTFTCTRVLYDYERVFASSGQGLLFFLGSGLESELIKLNKPIKSTKIETNVYSIFILTLARKPDHYYRDILIQLKSFWASLCYLAKNLMSSKLQNNWLWKNFFVCFRLWARQRQHLPVDVDGAQIGNVDVPHRRRTRVGELVRDVGDRGQVGGRGGSLFSRWLWGFFAKGLANLFKSKQTYFGFEKWGEIW